MIKVHNDGKGKYQSFAASTEVWDNSPGLSTTIGHGNVHVTGYGATEAEAIENMKKVAVDMQVQIARAIATPVQYVDCLGEPLEKTNG